LVTGGENAAGNILTSAELYNPATGRWAVTGSMATPRVSHTETLLPNGEVLVAGGIVGFNCSIAAGCMPIYTATAELYNPATGKWTTTSSMTTPRSDQGATLLQDGQVLVAGGIQNFPGQTTNSPYWLASAELYDPSKGTWSSTGSMNKPHAVVATLLQNGQVLIAEDQNAGELYHPSTGQWTLTAPMYYSGHTGISTALLTNGDVLLYGNHLPSYASEFYNPSADTWTNTKGQSTGGISPGPLMLLDAGKVLLAGGSTKYRGGTTNCLLYDPSNNTWLFTGSLKQLAAHTLTRLLDGRVLAVGGSDAELYTP
jgi:hypothetical protein